MSLLPGFLRVGFLSPSHLNISLQDQFSSAPESASSCLSLRGDALFFSRDLIFPNSVVPFQPGFIKKEKEKRGRGPGQRGGRKRKTRPTASAADKSVQLSSPAHNEQLGALRSADPPTCISPRCPGETMELRAPLVLLLATVWHGKSRKGGVREGVTERARERTLSVAAPH